MSERKPKRQPGPQDPGRGLPGTAGSEGRLLGTSSGSTLGAELHGPWPVISFSKAQFPPVQDVPTPWPVTRGDGTGFRNNAVLSDRKDHYLPDPEVLRADGLGRGTYRSSRGPRGALVTSWSRSSLVTQTKHALAATPLPCNQATARGPPPPPPPPHTAVLC